MASTRHPRVQQESQPFYAEETDIGSDQETPKPQRLRKRLSEACVPGDDASFGDQTGRPPLRTKSVNINDDAAEKRKRRKSNKLSILENALPGPSSEGMMVSEKDPTETVRTDAPASASAPTIADESSPPESEQAIGTSARVQRPTASRNPPRRRSGHSSAAVS